MSRGNYQEAHRMGRQSVLKQVFDLLWERFGPQGWWPGDSPLEIVVGAILTQNTNWKNVERAIDNLRDAGLLEWTALCTLPVEELGEIIRPAGYFRVKAQRLHNLVRHVTQAGFESLEEFLRLPTQELREQLVSIKGIGPETADSIVLYAAERPVFVVDTYTARILKRHNWIEAEADYHALQERFHDELPPQQALYNEFHALIVKTGKDYCRPRPQCDGCPLESLLPAGGPTCRTEIE
jgi:endonuclease-3 related protein